MPRVEESANSETAYGDTEKLPFTPKCARHAECSHSGMDEQLDPVTSRIIGCAIQLHRFLGPGLLESVYQRGLAIEFTHARIPFDSRRRINITYRGEKLGDFEPDFIVEDQVVVEVKSASAHDRVFDAQVLTYLRLTGLRTGLLLNFGRPVLKDGLKRFAL